RRRSDHGGPSRRSYLRSGEGEERSADELPLALLVLGPDIAIDQTRRPLVPHRGHPTPAGDHVARPGELRKARPEPADRSHATRLYEELPQVTHGQHAVREDPGVPRVPRELLVGVHG